LYLGGEELKLSVIALLLLGAGLFINLQIISAQEVPEQELDPLRIAEQSLTLAEDDAVVSAAAPGPSIWVVVRMLLTLALAAVAIYGVVYFIKRSTKPAAVSDPFLKILASTHLGSNRYAHIVSVGGKAWLLGSSDGGVNLIGEIDDKDVVNSMLLEESKKSAEAGTGRFPDFLSMLRRVGVNTESRNVGADDIRKRRERLKGL